MGKTIYVMVVSSDDEVILEDKSNDVWVLPSTPLKNDPSEDAQAYSLEMFGDAGKVLSVLAQQDEWVCVVIKLREPQSLPNDMSLWAYYDALGFSIPDPSLFLLHEFFANI